MKRFIFASQEVNVQAKQAKDGVVRVYSFWPVDRADCPCQIDVLKLKQRLKGMTLDERKALIADMKVLECTRFRKDMERYEVICAKCGDTQGYCYAKDATLHDWCDFHYVQWTRGSVWHGCLTPHISPITQRLAFECCCGQDTRDFRANMTLNKQMAERIEAKNAVGREMGQADSKFITRKITSDMIA